MSDLTLKPDLGADSDKSIPVPTLSGGAPIADALVKGQSARALRRRFSATRFLAANDSEFRPFRIY